MAVRDFGPDIIILQGSVDSLNSQVRHFLLEQFKICHSWCFVGILKIEKSNATSARYHDYEMLEKILLVF